MLKRNNFACIIATERKGEEVLANFLIAIESKVIRIITVCKGCEQKEAGI